MAGNPGNSRNQRIEAQMQRAISELLSREVKDPRIGKLTVTAVQVLADKSEAKVFVVPFGGAEPGPDLMAGLQRVAGFLRGEVGRQLALRHAPRLTFVLDDTFDKAARLSALISAAVKSDS